MPLPNVNEKNRCHAKAKHTGKQCNNLAVGETGVCKFHGGLGGRPPKTGLQVKSSKTDLDVKVEQALTDPNLKNLVNEIALARGLLMKVLEEVDEGEIDKKVFYKALSNIDTIRKLVETQIKIETENKFMISISELRLYMNQCGLILVNILSDVFEKLEKQFNTDLSDLFNTTKTKVFRMLGEIKIIDGEVKESRS